MKCEKCGEVIPEGDERDVHDRTVCEDCYLDSLSPAKACDPWAVFCAKSFSDGKNSAPALSENQSDILKMLRETGGSGMQTISEQLGIKPTDLEREIATLRHMEKVRGELRNGEKIIRLWQLN